MRRPRGTGAKRSPNRRWLGSAGPDMRPIRPGTRFQTTPDRGCRARRWVRPLSSAPRARRVLRVGSVFARILPCFPASDIDTGQFEGFSRYDFTDYRFRFISETYQSDRTGFPGRPAKQDSEYSNRNIRGNEYIFDSPPRLLPSAPFPGPDPVPVPGPPAESPQAPAGPRARLGQGASARHRFPGIRRTAGAHAAGSARAAAHGQDGATDRGAAR